MISCFSAPVSVCLGVTNACNLNCRHCLTAKSRKYNDMSSEELSWLARTLTRMKVFKIALFGGEPLVRKDFFKIVDILSNGRHQLSLNTNGTLITRDCARRLSTTGISSYCVSLDGASSDVHDLIRGKDAFKAAVEGIENLVYYGCIVRISATISKLNFNVMAGLAKLGKKLGAREVRFNDIMFIGRAEDISGSLCTSIDQKKDMFHRVETLKRHFGKSFIIGSVGQQAQLYKECLEKKDKPVFPLEFKGCAAGIRHCAIHPSGWVLPCEILWHEYAGNVRKQSFKDIWHSSAVMRSCRKRPVVLRQFKYECATCRWWRMCYQGGRCWRFYWPKKNRGRTGLACWQEGCG